MPRKSDAPERARGIFSPANLKPVVTRISLCRSHEDTYGPTLMNKLRHVTPVAAGVSVMPSQTPQAYPDKTGHHPRYFMHCPSSLGRRTTAAGRCKIYSDKSASTAKNVTILPLIMRQPCDRFNPVVTNPMNTKTLVLCCVSTALLGCPVLAADPSSAPAPMASVAKVVKVAGMDKAPVVVKKVIPAYPGELREQGIQGTATVDMLVDSTGRVVSAELVNATVPEFGQLALKAAKDWTFVPASAQGKPIATRVRVPFEFVMPQLVAMESR